MPQVVIVMGPRRSGVTALKNSLQAASPDATFVTGTYAEDIPAELLTGDHSVVLHGIVTPEYQDQVIQAILDAHSDITYVPHELIVRSWNPARL